MKWCDTATAATGLISFTFILALVLGRACLRQKLISRRKAPERIPRLPVEVCERVIDFVNLSFVGFNHESDKERQATLSACALTCRDWRPRSQLHLYTFLVLDDKCQFDRFMGTLRHNSEIATYISDMALRGNRAGKSFPTGAEHWTSLVSLPLNSLSNLDRITFKWCDWRNLHRSFFVLLSSVATITQLSLSGVQVRTSRELVYFIHSFPNLTNLSLLDVHCAKIVPHASNKRTKRTIPLESLRMKIIPLQPPETFGARIETSGALLNSLHDTESAPYMKSLDITTIERATQLELNRFLDNCSHLESLNMHLEMDLLDPTVEEHFDMTNCVSLRDFSIRYLKVPPSNSEFLSQTLSTIGSSSMKSITICLEEPRKDISLLDGIDWASMDAELDTPKFRHLDNVVVWIHILADIDSDFVEKRLPLLHARKKLTSQIRLQ